LFSGAFLFFFLLFGTSEDKFSLLLVLLMLVIVLLQRFLLTPEIISVGRTLDFVPLDMPTADRSKFWVLHGGYTGTELLKWGLGIALAVKLIARSARRSGDVRQEFDLVDKANHRHVDR
jgi:hypothetical protein